MKKQPAPKAPVTARAAALRWFGWTDIGRVRKNNEDSFLGLRFDAHEVQRLGKFGEASLAAHDYTFAVCDGMGGAKAGEYASQIAVDKITTLLPRSFGQSASGLEAGFADVLFFNTHGELTEGAISNVFLVLDGQWYTPPIACGLLDGVYRRHLLATRPGIVERVLTRKDLDAAEAIYLSNAVRGLRRVKLSA